MKIRFQILMVLCRAEFIHFRSQLLFRVNLCIRYEIYIDNIGLEWL
jgi:hypothetical protein